MISSLPNKLKNIILNTTDDNFEEVALEVFNFQYANNNLYRHYCDLINTEISKVIAVEQIPFLPIQFFKSQIIKTTDFDTETIFESSGTSGSVNSKHYVKDVNIYRESYMKCFRNLYGEETNFCIIGLLPSYLERKGSSLVYMVNDLINKSNNPDSGFYLYDHKKLRDVLLKNEAAKQQTILIGVTYALLDFGEDCEMELKNTVIMETGGMKGRRKELTRNEVHTFLVDKLGVDTVHSEYGMTELLSQAYSKGNGVFKCPSWMRILVRSEDDPFHVSTPKRMSYDYISGGINVIDLANIYSCSFIATDDAGKLYNNNSFEITGRLENSDIRGCSLMIV